MSKGDIKYSEIESQWQRMIDLTKTKNYTWEMKQKELNKLRKMLKINPEPVNQVSKNE